MFQIFSIGLQRRLVDKAEAIKGTRAILGWPCRYVIRSIKRYRSLR